MDENYVDSAKEVIESLRVKDKKTGEYIYINGKYKINLTTSKIRNILSMVSDLYNDTQRFREEKLDDKLYMRTQYLKMRMAYEAGRDNDVDDFIKKAELMEKIGKIGRSKEKLLNFCYYMEALVAYHKFYGGKEN